MGILSTKSSKSDNEIARNFHFPSSKNALIIFTRNPELGKCKTRLAASIGDEAALQVYSYLLQHTATIAQQVKADRYVFYSENIIENDIWNNEKFRKKLQQGADLGERMHNAFTELFISGYEKVVIIGSDLLDLNDDIITTAFGTLNTFDVSIGPATDGGYYLLGLKKMHSEIFKNKDWGTSSVLSETLKDLKNSNVHLLKELNDIDTFEDMQHYEQLKKFYKPS